MWRLRVRQRKTTSLTLPPKGEQAPLTPLARLVPYQPETQLTLVSVERFRLVNLYWRPTDMA